MVLKNKSLHILYKQKKLIE